jgi:hypothetical protein
MLVTVVHSPACHLCDEAQEALSRLAEDFPVRVELLDSRTPEGQRLVRAHRSALFPLVLLDGAYFSAGRLPRLKLRRLLERRTVGA